jgi:thiol-disulfide isomerase/thioredoxin
LPKLRRTLSRRRTSLQQLTNGDRNAYPIAEMSEVRKFDRRRFLNGAFVSLAAGIAESVRAKPRGSTLLLPISEGELPTLKHATEWLNSQPLDAANLRGKVVLVNFWTYTCINWLRTLPYIRGWSDKYKGQGLVVIGVHTPEFSFEHKIENVRRAAEEMKVEYPIAIDNDYAIWRAFENEYWPALYFVDATGRIRYHRFGEGEYERSEIVIRELLREAGRSDVGNELVSLEGRGVEAAADWASLQSSENYVGAARTQGFVLLRERRCYAIPPRLKLNHWALAGDWKLGRETIALNESGGRIGYRFQARDLHLVMSPATPGSRR